MRIFVVIGLATMLAGCGLGETAAYVAGTYAVSKSTTDKNPVEHAAWFFGKRCEAYSYYDKPSRCLN
ncbi:MAG: hypothetical protein HOL85_07120 [Rhodospirillaceae bacterium]|mgnify:CR=1 FL=1|jgi:hypothetical protein|nr:hypothetical protein [Rhodospirillaceae bacterium]MBT6138924.1 hypothetical protein [Rhodospirillaceae bacterium]